MDSVRPKRLKKRQTGRVGAVEAEFFNGLLVLSPDEERFSLEPSGFDSFTVDLVRDELNWCYPPHAHD